MLAGTYGTVSWKLRTFCVVLGCWETPDLAFWDYAIVGVV